VLRNFTKQRLSTFICFSYTCCLAGASIARCSNCASGSFLNYFENIIKRQKKKDRAPKWNSAASLLADVNCRISAGSHSKTWQNRGLKTKAIELRTDWPHDLVIVSDRPRWDMKFLTVWSVWFCFPNFARVQPDFLCFLCRYVPSNGPPFRPRSTTDWIKFGFREPAESPSSGSLSSRKD